MIIFALELIPKPRADYESLEEENITPEYYANIFSRISFHWMSSMMKKGYSKVLTMDDLWNLKPEDTAELNSNVLQSYLIPELEKNNPSLLRVLYYAFRKKFFLTGFFKLLQDILQFTQPQLLNLIMLFAASYASGSQVEPIPIYVGLAIAVLMLLTGIVQTFFLHQYFQGCFMMGAQIRSALIQAIYIKSLKLSSSSRQISTVGEITNLMSVDTSKIADICGYVHILWSGPLQIIIAIYFLLKTLGPSVFTGIAVILIMVPINGVIATVSRRLNKKQMGNKDSRTKIMDEVLSGMKVIKLYAWEKPFIEKILRVREQELVTLKKIAYLQSAGSFTWSVTPFLVAFSTFGTYSLISDEPLTSTKVFVSLSLFNLLAFPLSMFPSMVTSAIEASVSFQRILDFLKSEEKDSTFVVKFTDPKNEDRVIIKNGVFGWEKESNPILKDINMIVRKGRLQAIIGVVGAGKSSLLSAILGDLYKMSGEVLVNGSVAYVSQTAWIQNSSLRENILFGLPYEKEYYEKTLEACGLKQDLSQLVAGDSTEIGERGINLSGGQKQRVAIARAVYSRREIYLFDDALSAVDAHVGRHIFEKVLGRNGLLKDKARILVTHGIQYLSGCDQICMLSDSVISECGSFESLMADKNSSVYSLIKSFGKRSDEKTEVQGDNSPEYPSESASLKATSEKSKLITKEESAKGKVDWNVYKSYATSCGIHYVIMFILMAIGSQCLSVSQNFLLSRWADENDKNERKNLIELIFLTATQILKRSSVTSWLSIYFALGLSASFMLVFQVLFAWVFCGIRSARILHMQLLNNVLRLPQSFFDTTPLGRILNRFSKDQYTVDEVLPRSFLGFFRTLFVVISVLGVNALGNPYFVLFAIPLFFIYAYFQRFYLSTSRELKRLDSTSRSPIYSNFQETLYGVNLIRAYSQEDRFIKEMENRVDYNQRAYYPSVSSNRWLAVRLELIGSLIVFGSATFGVLALQFDRSSSAAVIGLMLVYSLSITQTLNWMVRQSCEIETNIVSVERIKEYIELPQEAPRDIPATCPPQTWPEAGAITFRNYSTRYRTDLPCVVRNLDFAIKSREKIGIVGRTGAGKSSITMALFRIMEASEGAIEIDGIDISTIGLGTLREAISIIPQDPVLFNGTVRYNLDPFDRFDDSAIWAALESVNLKGYIASLPSGLLNIVHQNGENFSVGQRQLICLARALIRNSKILVLDEATAAIDVETDLIIQKTIRSELKNCTILTIAHRLNTLSDYDRIIVLDSGSIVEFDSPAALLERKGSFYKLAQESRIGV